MILEAIVTTSNEDGTTNISPMGPTVSSGGGGVIEEFQLRPFDTSRTFANLKRTRCGVMHVTDDVMLFALTSIGQKPENPTLIDAESIEGKILADACRFYEFKVGFIDETSARMNLNCSTVRQGKLRDFWGFNRAKHAVLEAAIFATRLDFLPKQEIEDSMSRLKVIVEKTAGEQEAAAMDLILRFMAESQRA